MYNYTALNMHCSTYAKLSCYNTPAELKRNATIMLDYVCSGRNDFI